MELIDSVSFSSSVSAEKKEMNRVDNADMRSCASRESLPVRYMRVDSIMPPPFRLKVGLSAPEQFQVNAAELCEQCCDILVIFDTLGNLVTISFWDRIKLGLPIVIRRKVEAFVPLAIGTSAVRLAAFNGSGDQGTSHDMGWVWHPVEQFLTADFESVSGH